MNNWSQNHEQMMKNHEIPVPKSREIGPGSVIMALGAALGPQGRQRRKREPKGGSLDPPPQEGPQSGPKMGPFFFWSLRDTKKGGPGRPSRIGPFFGRCWGLPGGPQEGSRLDGSSIFTFAGGPKRAPK